MRSLKILALMAVFATLFANFGTFSVQAQSSSSSKKKSSSSSNKCFHCGGFGSTSAFGITATCVWCGGTGKAGGGVPVNTSSGGYENNNGSYNNNNTNTKKTNKGLEKAKEYYESYGEKDCPSCHGSGTCSTCNGKGWFYSSYGTGKVDCPNCCYSNKGKCGRCCGTGKVYGKKY